MAFSIVFLAYLPDGTRGGQRNLIHLFRGLDRARFLPHLVVPALGGLTEEAERIGVEHHVIPLRETDLPEGTTIADGVKELRNLLITLDARILYVDGAAHVQAAAAANLGLRTRLLWHVQVAKSSPEDAKLLAMVDGVVCCSLTVANRFSQGHFPNRPLMKTIVNAVDLIRFQPKNAIAGHLESGREERKPVLLYVGEVETEKGVGELVSAFHIVIKTHPAALLKIAGRGPALTSLADAANALGYRNDIAELLRSATLMVMPSHSEGLSLSLLEAGAVGCPIVASNIAGNTELLSEEYKFLFPPGDSRRLAECILAMLADLPLARKLAKITLDRVHRRHDVKDFVNAFSDMFLALVHPTRQSSPG